MKKKLLIDIFQKYATDGWSGDATCLGSEEFLKAIKEIEKLNLKNNEVNIKKLTGTDRTICKCGHTFWEHRQYQNPKCNCSSQGCHGFQNITKETCEYLIKEHTKILNRLKLYKEEFFKD